MTDDPFYYVKWASEIFRRSIFGKAGDVDPDIHRSSQIWACYADVEHFASHFMHQCFEQGVPEEEVSKMEPGFSMIGAWCWSWAENAFPTLQTSGTYGAAMMATDSNNLNSTEDLHLPWKTFRMRIPEGLLDDGDRHYRWLYVLSDPDVFPSSILFLTERHLTSDENDGTATRMFMVGAPTLDELLFLDVPKWMEGERHLEHTIAPEFKARCMALAIRMLVGLLYTLQHTNNFKEKKSRHGYCTFGERRASPDHRNIFCGKPLKVNVRSEIRRWLGTSGDANKSGAPPSFQKLIRGHLKRQVVGIGRVGRKIIWVEPYWRGHPDAPILVKPYEVA